MRNEHVDALYTYENEFVSDHEPLGDFKGHEVYMNLNIDRPYPPVRGRPAYQEIRRAGEALEKQIQELIQLGVLRKVGHNEEAEVKTSFFIFWQNYK
ncbi:hypothetical protein O181_043178 [Austropuccinia psidii MF-1]|uniref:Uncharacterized protein n=1 Tax=Austropuccinia psidii MF-1 TaxID=1389203 RepID=A0A9Q3DKT7_9BASI|nr:hypothetical protein [Austropuccinia psidii MF-1]